MFGKEQEKQYNINKKTVPTDLSNVLTKEQAMVQYDAACKKILSEKIILAWILRRVVKEFQGYSLEEIQECIEAESITASNGYPEDDLMVKDCGRINGMSNESKDSNGAIYYDIRFCAYVPNSKEKIKLIINVEAQRAFYVGYCMETRAVTYSARMISDQIGVEVINSNYNDLKKVYSIFICMNVPKRTGNVITSWKTVKEDLHGHFPDRPWAYDKMVSVLVCLNPNVEDDDEFLGMMNTLLTEDIEIENRKKTLEEKYMIPMNVVKEVGNMCNLSEYVFDRGVEKGIAEGISQGITKGISQGEESLIQNLIRVGVSDDQILEASGYTKEKLDEIKGSLQLQ